MPVEGATLSPLMDSLLPINVVLTKRLYHQSRRTESAPISANRGPVNATTGRYPRFPLPGRPGPGQPMTEET